MALDYTVRPLPPWPGKLTPHHQRKKSPFKGVWTRTLKLIEREVRHLGGKNVKLHIDVDESYIRQDGGLRSNARPSSPAVILAFDTPKQGTLAFPCDTFAYWEDNIKAIGLTLDALRRVDRYGVQRGLQYTGFRALPEKTASTMTASVAADLLGLMSDVLPGAILTDRELARSAVRVARLRTHPDRSGGSDKEWLRVEGLRQVLEQHHGGSLT